MFFLGFGSGSEQGCLPPNMTGLGRSIDPPAQKAELFRLCMWGTSTVILASFAWGLRGCMDDDEV